MFCKVFTQHEEMRFLTPYPLPNRNPTNQTRRACLIISDVVGILCPDVLVEDSIASYVWVAYVFITNWPCPNLFLKNVNITMMLTIQPPLPLMMYSERITL